MSIVAWPDSTRHQSMAVGDDAQNANLEVGLHKVLQVLSGGLVLVRIQRKDPSSLTLQTSNHPEP